MTPLAAKAFRYLADGKSIAYHDGDAGDVARPLRRSLESVLAGAQFFEMSALWVPACELLRECSKLDAEAYEAALSPLMFLPAPITWFEYSGPEGREAMAMARTDDDPSLATLFIHAGNVFARVGEVCLDSPSYVPGPRLDRPTKALLSLCIAFRALINSPKMIERRERPTDIRVERAAKKAGLKVSVRPWTEVRLRGHDDDREAESKGCGSKKGLHFCRSHIRVRRGVIQRVRGHWRGDPSRLANRAGYVVKP